MHSRNLALQSMAALDNPAWKSLKNSETTIVGPSYDYLKEVPTTEEQGIGSAGSFGQLSTNLNAGLNYVSIIGKTSRPLGDSYFINTGGSCINSTGKVVPRYNYVNNIPPESRVLGRGLASGVMNDIRQMNPILLYKALKSDALPACQKYRCKVTNRSNGDTQYLAPFLTPDFNKNDCFEVGEPADAGDAAKQEVEDRTNRVKELESLVSQNPDNQDFRKQLSKERDELSALLEEQLVMTERRKQYPLLVSKESFELMNSPMLGGVILAGVLLATLVFRK